MCICGGFATDALIKISTMMLLKYILALMCLLVCFSCHKDNNTLISKDEYLDYVNYDTTDWCKKCNAQSVMIKDMLFHFDMNVPIDLSSIKYDFMIIRQGVIYIGPFEKNITIKNLSFCMDDNLSKVNTLAFVILDHTNKQVYKWYNKESYYLYKKDKCDVTLEKNGEFYLK